MSHYGGRSDDRYNDRSSYRDSYGGGGGGYGSYGGGGGGRGGDSMSGLGSGLRNISWDLSTLPVFEKNFYIEHPAVTARSDGYADEWRQSKGITVIGRGVPKVKSIAVMSAIPINMVVSNCSP